MSYASGLILGTASTTAPDFPSCLAIVNRILLECRISPQVTTLNPGNTNTNIAFEAIQDAQQQVWAAERWDWRKRSAFIPMQAGMYDYTLPSDFDELLIPPCINGTTQLTLMDAITFHTTWGFYDPAPTAGTPQAAVLLANAIRLYPPPSSDAVAAIPRMELLYLRKAPPRLAVAQELDSLDLPTEFLSALVAYGKFALKNALAYPDANQDLARFNELLQYQIRRASKSVGPPRMRRAGPAIMTDQDF